VLEKKLGYSLSHEDIFINVAGGIKIEEPAADLAVAVAVASSFKNRPVKENMVVIGEVGLAGEVRSVSYMEKRIQEAAKLGFAEAVVPFENAAEFATSTIRIEGVKTVKEAVEAALI
jgi:DNA repair protein RadA/Sms